VEVKTYCPNCGVKSLSFNKQKGVEYCFVCERGQKINSRRAAIFLPQVVGSTLFTEEKKILRSSLSKISEYHMLLLEDWGITEADFDWLLPLTEIDGEAGRIAFRCHGGNLLQTRAINRATKGSWRMVFDNPQDTEPTWFAIPPAQSTVILVEGILDTIRCRQAGVFGVSMLGLKVNPRLPYELHKNGVTDLIIWTDPDRAGIVSAHTSPLPNAIKPLRGKVPRAIPRSLFPNPKIISYSKEPADCSPEEILEVLNVHM
jgi:hypothetical protein